jgi:hypothetical protein
MATLVLIVIGVVVSAILLIFVLKWVGGSCTYGACITVGIALGIPSGILMGLAAGTLLAIIWYRRTKARLATEQEPDPE